MQPNINSGSAATSSKLENFGMMIPQQSLKRDWNADIGLKSFTTNLVDTGSSTYYSAASLLNSNQ